MNVIKVIRQWLKLKYDKIDNTRFKDNLLNALPFWLGALITGVAAVFYAKLFSWAEEGTYYIFHKAGWLFFIITPLSFLLALWLVYKFAPYAKGSGIPQVIAAIKLKNQKQTQTNKTEQKTKRSKCIDK